MTTRLWPMSIRSPRLSRRAVRNGLGPLIVLGVILGASPMTAQTLPAPQSDPPAPPGKPSEQLPGMPDRSNESLSDRLERDKGVITPPRGITPDNAIVPDDPGRIRVFPPPGSPQGDPKVQPK